MENKEIKTYLGLSTESENGQKDMIDFDLVSARQKGQEIRYLAISITNSLNEQQQQQSITVDEESFNQIKTFFSNLKWDI